VRILRRGELYWAELPSPAGRRPVLIVLRDEAIRRTTRVVVAPISSNIRQLESEVPVGRGEGLPYESVAQCDGLQTIDRHYVEPRPLGRLGSAKLRTLDEALRYALDVKCPPLARYR
jgi:mRNA interferase MazF